MCTEQVRLLKDCDNRSPAIDLKNHYRCDNLALKREREISRFLLEQVSVILVGMRGMCVVERKTCLLYFKHTVYENKIIIQAIYHLVLFE